MLFTIMSIQPKESSGGGGETREDVVTRQTREMLSKLPQDYDPFEVKERQDGTIYCKTFDQNKMLLDYALWDV